MVISNTNNDYLFSAWETESVKPEEEVTLNSALGDEKKADKGDSFGSLGSDVKVDNYKPTNKSNVLNNDFFSSRAGEDNDINTKEGYKDYSKELQPFYDQMKEKIAEGDDKGAREVLDQMQDKIRDDIMENKIYDGSQGYDNNPSDLSQEDFKRATEAAQKAQEDQLQGLIDKAIGAGAGGSGGGGFNADDLIRQARIDKWEALKDQQMVYYLKATLAGIKASQSLAKSVQ